MEVPQQPSAHAADRQLLGQRLRQARLAIGYNQAGVASTLGLSTAAISHFERGKRNINTTQLRQLATCLKVDATYLLGQVPQRPAPTSNWTYSPPKGQ